MLELLDKLERKESLSELWTLELPDEAELTSFDEFRLLELLREAAEAGRVGGSILEAVEAGAWTSTLNLADTFVTCWAVGVEQREELRLWPCKMK